MRTFSSKLSDASGRRVILACDYTGRPPTASPVIRDVKRLSAYICAVKINYHLLLPLGARQVSRITDAAHGLGLQAIADIKLNDIGNTNGVATEILWGMGFDAVIANPIMGLDGLRNLVRSAHRRGRGVITLCHMSAPEARTSYEMRAHPTPRSKSTRRMYEIFLDWALDAGADGIIVGATFPGVIGECSRRIQKSGRRLLIISPGVGAQGADAADTVRAGSDYVIAGRSIIQADDMARAAASMHQSIASGRA